MADRKIGLTFYRLIYFLSAKTIELRDIRAGEMKTSVKCKLILPCLSERF